MRSIVHHCLYILLYIPPVMMGATSTDKFRTEDALKLSTAIEQIKSYYIDETTYSSLIENAISGLVHHLDDYCEYLDENALAQLNTHNDGKFVGIGAELQPHKEGLEVVASFDGSPAARAELKSGDIITHVDGYPLKELAFSKALHMFRGKPSTSLRITLIRSNASNVESITLNREVLSYFSVSYQIINDHIAYIKIPLFTDKTDQEVEKTIEKIKLSTKINGLIIDLRDNPGGLLESAVRTSDLFLDSARMKNNITIVSTKSRSEHARFTALATPGDILNHKPIVILVNRGSASSSEIMASALKDHHRALLIGQKTFGKASIQSLISLDKNSAIKITTGLYQTPKGQLIQGVGIEPDYPITPVTPAAASLQDDPFIQESLKLLNGSSL